MAFFQKAAHRPISFEGIKCPVCDEEFDEPKQLPCHHTVCVACLEEAERPNAMLLICPIDDQELPLPPGGISMLPTDARVLRLIEKQARLKGPELMKPRKERDSSKVMTPRKRAPQETALTVKELEAESERVREEIKEMGDKLRDMVAFKEKQLNEALDKLVAKEKSAIESGDASTTGSKGGKSNTFLLDLTGGRKALSELKDKGLGKVKHKDELDMPGGTLPIPLALLKARKKVEGGVESVGSLNIPVRLKSKFTAGSVAVSDDGNIAVCDNGSSSILVYSKKGELLFQVGKLGTNEAVDLEFLSGVAFLGDGSLVVSDGPLEERQKLLLFDSRGKFKKVLVECDDSEDLWFGSVTVDEDDRIVLACSGSNPHIRVYTKSGDLDLMFGSRGDDQITGPEKAVFYDGEFFISDSCSGRNQSCIRVFNEDGEFERKFDQDRLSTGQQDNWGIEITHPIKMTVDYENNTILAYHSMQKIINIYNPEGTFVTKLPAVSGIRDLTLSEDRKIIVSCGDDSEWPRSVQYIPYLWDTHLRAVRHSFVADKRFFVHLRDCTRWIDDVVSCFLFSVQEK